MTNEQHNDYISWAFIAHGAFQLFMMLLIFAIFGLFLPDPGAGPPMGFMFIIFGFMFLFQMLFVVPSFVAAYALRQKKSWARLAAIIAGVVSAMNVPIGTAACVYALWFFLGENWKEVYQDRPAAFDAETRQLTHEREERWTGYRTDEKGEVVFHQVDPPDWR